MRIRLTARDARTGSSTDVVVECAAHDTVADALALICDAFPQPAASVAAVGGVRLDTDQRVTDSLLREGVVVEFNGPADHSARARTGYLLRVTSGPAAGAEYELPPGRTIRIGRGQGADFIVDDPDVSRLHATAEATAAGLHIVDRDSANHVYVNDQKVATALVGDGDAVQVGGSRIVIRSAGQESAPLAVEPDTGRRILNRVRRTAEQPTVPAISLPAALSDEDGHSYTSWLLLATPIASGVLLAIISGHYYFLLTCLLGPAAAYFNQRREKRAQRRKTEARHTAYNEKVRTAQAAAEAAVDELDAYERATLPDPASVTRTAIGPRVELWHRQPDDPDWLKLRFGVADQPAGVTVTGERPPNWREPVLLRAPVAVSLGQAGAIGISGPAETRAATVRWLLAQLAVQHAPKDLAIVPIIPRARDAEWGWLRWLPHVRDLNDTVTAAWSDEDVDPTVQWLQTAVDERALQGGVQLPYYVVVLADEQLRQRPAVARLLSHGPAAQILFLCLAEDDRLLPLECKASVRHTPQRTVVVASGREVPIEPDSISVDDADRIGRSLASIVEAGGGQAGGIPAGISYRELAGIPDANGILAGWRIQPAATKVAIGSDGTGSFPVDFVEQGPHGLIAGTTRSGKSELVQTMMAALARHNTPEDLNFLFIDYKGGPTFKDLRDLPHVVATVTNLNESLVIRAISSLRAELKRRQTQINAVHTDNITEYRKKRQTDPSLPPFPRLLILVDEYAELVDNLNPAVLDEFVSVARTGASLGVHLILATQQPQGIIKRQIRANMSLAICLRVNGPQDSEDMIGRPDAYWIPVDRPGRAYVQIGNEVPRQIQTARINMVSPRNQTTRRAVALRWNDRAAPASASSATAGTTDLQELVSAITDGASYAGLAAPYTVLQPPLPVRVRADDLPDAQEQARFHIRIGLQDQPDRQRWATLTLPLGTGALAVIGSAQSGRSGAIRSVAADLACRYRPDEVQLHVLDGAGTLARLADLPHTGVCCPGTDLERADRLLVRLSEEAAKRRQFLASVGAGSVHELWAAKAFAPPHIVLLVDGWASFAEEDGGPRRQALADLAATGGSLGITVCVSSDLVKLRAGGVLAAIPHKLVLTTTNAADTKSLLDLTAVPAGMPPGRGLWGADSSPVQVPLLTDDPDSSAQNRAVEGLGRRLTSLYATGVEQPPLRLDPLPTSIRLDDPLFVPAGGPRVPLGAGGDVLSCRWLPLDRPQRVLIAGSPRSGRTTAAASYAASLAAQGVRVAFVGSHVPAVKVFSDLAAVSGEAYDVLVVDDLDSRTTDAETLFRPGTSVIATVRQESLTMARGVIATLKNSAAATILLTPVDRAILRDYRVGEPGPAPVAGRAILVMDNRPQPLQVPDAS